MSQGRLHWKPKSAFPPLKFEANTFVCREDEYLSSAGIITTSSKSGDKTGKSTCSKVGPSEKIFHYINPFPAASRYTLPLQTV